MNQTNLAVAGGHQTEPAVNSRPRSHLVIKPTASRWQRLDPRALWRYRELTYFFTVRDLKLRYKQTALGVLWTVLQPLLATGVFSVLFGKMAKLDSDGVPYPIFCFSAIVPWTYFSNSLSRGATSLVANSHLLNKIYFPRVLIPVSAMMPGLVDFGFGFGIFLPLAFWFGFRPSPFALLTVPLLTLLMFCAALGFSLGLSAINVRFRDVSNALPFVVQTWMFLTPVIYPVSLVSSKYRWALALNPMAGIIGGFRSAVFGLPWDIQTLGISAAVAVLALAGGIFIFTGMERTFADQA